MSKRFLGMSLVVMIMALVAGGVSAQGGVNRNDSGDRGPLSKITFIHYRRGASPKAAEARPPWAGGGGGGSTDTSSCYAFLAKGAKWKTESRDFLVNATSSGLNADSVTSVFQTSANTWDAALNGFDVFGSASRDDNAVINQGDADGESVVTFGDYSNSGVIAVTSVWGYFYGPPSTRELVDWDMLMNTDYDWSMGSELNKMDVENIATHELGHSAGLADLYDTSCEVATMFGYADYGDTDKRSLDIGDITGINALYK